MIRLHYALVPELDTQQAWWRGAQSSQLWSYLRVGVGVDAGAVQAVAELPSKPPAGGYPAPPKGPYPRDLMEAGMLGRRRAGGRRPWLLPGPFQNAKLNRVFDEVMDEFVDAESGVTPEPALLRELCEETVAVLPEGERMLSGHDQGRLLAALVRGDGWW
jgi:hypothetical protein